MKHILNYFLSSSGIANQNMHFIFFYISILLDVNRRQIKMIKFHVVPLINVLFGRLKVAYIIVEDLLKNRHE